VPLADDSDSGDDSSVIITSNTKDPSVTLAYKSTGDNERQWEESFAKAVDSLKKTSVSKIKALFNEEGETSGEGESLSQVVNSIQQAASVKKIPSMFSPGPAVENVAVKREASPSFTDRGSPLKRVKTKVDMEHLQDLRLATIATSHRGRKSVGGANDDEEVEESMFSLSSWGGVTNIL
jgi:hypothetical protein